MNRISSDNEDDNNYGYAYLDRETVGVNNDNAPSTSINHNVLNSSFPSSNVKENDFDDDDVVEIIEVIPEFFPPPDSPDLSSSARKLTEKSKKIKQRSKCENVPSKKPDCLDEADILEPKRRSPVYLNNHFKDDDSLPPKLESKIEVPFDYHSCKNELSEEQESDDSNGSISLLAGHSNDLDATGKKSYCFDNY